MAAKCANCGSTNVEALAGSNGCLDCGKQTPTNPGVESREGNIVGEAKPEDPGTDRPDIGPDALQAARDLVAAAEAAENADKDNVEWVMKEERDAMVERGEIAPRDRAMRDAARKAREKARPKEGASK